MVGRSPQSLHRPFHSNLAESVTLWNGFVTAYLESTSFIKAPSAFVRLHDFETYRSRPFRRRPRNNACRKLICASRATKQGVDPHCHQVNYVRIGRIVNTGNDPPRAVGNLQDECRSRRQPLLPVGCSSGEFPFVRRAKGVRRVEHRPKSEVPQHSFVTDSCAPGATTCVVNHG